MSSTTKSASEGVGNSCKDRQLTDMSPVTDLAFNLKSLKTISTGTPTRRISWSDPFKNNVIISHIDELSPSNDSPMSFGASTKQPLKKTVSRKLLSLNSEQDKENVPPEDNTLCKVLSSENDEVTCSQDSGYSSASSKKNSSSAYAPNPRLRPRSSLFSLNITDGIFSLDEDSNMECEPESTVMSLLTQPLCSVLEAGNSTKKEKSPTRRCLAIDMETSCDSLNMMFDLTQNESLVSQEITKNITSTDLEPLQKLPLKRPDASTVCEWQSKRRKSSPGIDSDKIGFVKQRSFSETAATIMQAVQKADLQPDLIGDCSRCYALPLVKGRHQDLKCITPETLVDVLRGEYSGKIDSYTLIDCRYPYEFQGGHIQGAVNIYTKEEIIETFLKEAPKSLSKNVIIFHCEFSSERAPNLCRFLRNKDREVNECSYPKLHHPEIYLLDGGYKAFFQSFREYCVPQDYKPMNHKDHSTDLRLFRAKSKSWGSDSKIRLKVKSTTENIDI